MVSPAIDGHITGIHTGGTTVSATLTTTLSNDIICCVVYGEVNNGGVVTAPTITGVSGTGTTGWVQRSVLSQTNVSGSGWALSFWYGTAASALAGILITATMAHTVDDSAILLFGVNGANATTPFDSNVSLPAALISSGSSTHPTATITTSNADDLILAFTGVTNFLGNQNNPPSGFTLIEQVVNGGGANGCELGGAQLQVSALQTGVSVTWGASAGQLNSNDRIPFIVDAITADAPGGGVVPTRPSGMPRSLRIR